MEQIRRRKRRRRRRYDKRKILILIGAIVILIAAIVGGVMWRRNSYIHKFADDQVAEGIYLGEQSLAGMTKSEVLGVVEHLVNERESIAITLVTTEPEASERDVALMQFGFTDKNGELIAEEAVAYGKTGSITERYKLLKDLEKNHITYDATYKIDIDLVSQYVEENYSTMVQEPVDASLSFSNGGIVLNSGINGMTIDIQKAVSDIEAFMGDHWEGESGRIDMSVIEVEPEVTDESLADVKDLLGDFDTYCAKTVGRYDNVKRAAELINGTVLLPGEEMSVAGTISPISAENGYAMAGSYSNGEVVESIGGGICQVCSTVYNAVLYSELEVTKRAAHSMLVSYVKPSKDAAIAGDYKDLKFVNNTDAPIYIYAALVDTSLEVAIYGKDTRAENRSIKFESVILEDTGYGDPIYEENAGLELGKINKIESGHIGQAAELWKHIYVDDELQDSVKINSSNYRSSPETYEVGTASANAQATAMVSEAIKAQNTDTLNAAIAQAQSVIQAAAAQAAADKAAADQAAAEQAAADQAANQATE